VQKYINHVHTWLLIDSTWTLGEAIVEELGLNMLSIEDGDKVPALLAA